jgi:hypothetical protein
MPTLAGAREEDIWRRAVACPLVAGTDVRDLSDRAKLLFVAAKKGSDRPAVPVLMADPR